jgi:hypothetical protein
VSVTSPARCSCITLTPLALNLLARGLLPCTRTRLRKRTELAVSPASRCFCFDLCMGGGSSPCVAPPSSLHSVTTSASPPFFLARHAITAPLPPRGPRPACIRITPSAAVRARPPPFSTSSSQCRLTSSAASSSTISDVLHARLHGFPRAGPRRVVAPWHREP